MSVRTVRVPSADEVRTWPVTVGVPDAGRCWGLGRDASYDLARIGQFPVPVLRLGSSLRVTRASILTALGIRDAAFPAPSAPAATEAKPLVNVAAPDTRSDARPSAT